MPLQARKSTLLRNTKILLQVCYQASVRVYSQLVVPNHFKVSTEKNALDEVGEEEFEDGSEPDSDDECPEFEGYVKTFNNSIQILIAFIFI